jgi:hypothetical protein
MRWHEALQTPFFFSAFAHSPLSHGQTFLTKVLNGTEREKPINPKM